jgi:hypothetical protein
MKMKLHTHIAAVLILVFALSNIGLPVVMYFCPMMQENPSECQTMCENPTTSLAIVNQNGPCCDSYIIAERNTTPFVKTEKSNPSISLAIAPQIEQSATHIASVQFFQHEISPQASPPIFLLNSAFLI